MYKKYLFHLFYNQKNLLNFLHISFQVHFEIKWWENKCTKLKKIICLWKGEQNSVQMLRMSQNQQNPENSLKIGKTLKNISK